MRQMSLHTRRRARSRVNRVRSPGANHRLAPTADAAFRLLAQFDSSDRPLALTIDLATSPGSRQRRYIPTYVQYVLVHSCCLTASTLLAYYCRSTTLVRAQTVHLAGKDRSRQTAGSVERRGQRAATTTVSGLLPG